MISRNLIVLKRKVRHATHNIKAKIGNITLKIAVVALLALVVTQEQLVFNVSIRYPPFDGLNEFVQGTQNDKTKSFESTQTASILPTHLLADNGMNLANEATAVSDALTPEQQQIAAQYSNLGFVMNPNYGQEKGIDPAVVSFKKQKCANYISKYLNIAQEEAKLYNIPVAITLAQGLLESNAGDSKLAQKENNHFGIKCHAKCTSCRCANYTDDSKYDMFRVFDTPWFSFREHSKLLQGKRYKHLLLLPRTDYRNWAYGLQSAGYATDKKYAEKLIKIIEALKLHQYDAV